MATALNNMTIQRLIFPVSLRNVSLSVSLGTRAQGARGSTKSLSLTLASGSLCPSPLLLSYSPTPLLLRLAFVFL